MLVLPIKKKWFDMILSGEKKEEYREIKPYYNSRFLENCIIYTIPRPVFRKSLKQIDYVIFRNGYRKDSPKIKCLVALTLGTGNPKWGAEPNKLYYVFKILSVEVI